MKLQEVKRPYDCIISLGNACDPALHLSRRGLRRSTLPLDWAYTPSLHDASLLFEHRFFRFMLLKHMKVIGSVSLDENRVVKPSTAYFVKDFYSRITSMNDFPIIPGQPWDSAYLSFKKILYSRIQRLYQILYNSESILFIRWGADVKEAAAFMQVITKRTTAACYLLVINPSFTQEHVKEIYCGIERVCILNVPHTIHDTKLWDSILEGITLTNLFE